MTLLAAPTVEAKFTADSDAWDPSALNSTLADFFAGHDPKRTFSATALMVED
ncbi:Putative short chain dehydrogenase/reductase [Mycobacteroides abscessus]|nr:Putative short chain dehydrogenase/reductase [Mycobacteroides abscessus]